MPGVCSKVLRSLKEQSSLKNVQQNVLLKYCRVRWFTCSFVLLECRCTPFPSAISDYLFIVVTSVVNSHSTGHCSIFCKLRITPLLACRKESNIYSFVKHFAPGFKAFFWLHWKLGQHLWMLPLQNLELKQNGYIRLCSMYLTKQCCTLLAKKVSSFETYPSYCCNRR